MCSQITYQLRDWSIKFRTENCREETCILSVLISHEPNFTCRILENTNSFVFSVVLVLVNEVGAPITVQSECTTLTRLAKWVGCWLVHSHLSFLFQSISKSFVNGKGPWFFFFFQFISKFFLKGEETKYAEELHKMAFGF
jgi:hypothetical protein